MSTDKKHICTDCRIRKDSKMPNPYLGECEAVSSTGKNIFLRFLPLLLSVLLGLFGTFFLTGTVAQREIAAEVQQGIAQEVLRFHVRANSDSEEDQRVKMLVKERIVTYLQPILEQADSLEETRGLLIKQLQQVETLAQQILQEEACDYNAHARIGISDFPEKTYGDCRFPAGSYEALIIELGVGKGGNWWCMLYPGLCFFSDTYGIVDEEGKEKLKNVLTEEEFTWVTDWNHIHLGFKWF